MSWDFSDQIRGRGSHHSARSTRVQIRANQQAQLRLPCLVEGCGSEPKLIRRVPAFALQIYHLSEHPPFFKFSSGQEGVGDNV